MTKIYRSDEDKMMQDQNKIRWSSSSIMKHKPEDENSIQGFLGLGQIQERFLISDIATHGCSGGVSGLTYYTETIAFYDKHKDEIWRMLYDMSEDQGFSIPFLISDFKGADNVDSDGTFKNLLVWWAVEQKAREIEQD
tara:strand:- start:339 stop:752 length:414 start_codon:yes stop_codon:yes gene_type:complete